MRRFATGDKVVAVVMRESDTAVGGPQSIK